MPLKFLNWSDAAAHFHRGGEGYVLITVLTVTGSAPREAGTKMLVSADLTVNTIGGGHLEFSAIKKARQLLLNQYDQQAMVDYPLGPKLGQCCGGRVTLLFECFAATAAQIAVFGAGHVGRALVAILAELPVKVRWFDSRENEFPDQIPANVTRVVSPELADDIVDLPVGSLVVVLTHQHPLDYAIVEAVLKRGDTKYLGVIGSQTKARRFKMRLQHRGFSDESIAQMQCPMGLENVPGKHPMEVAVSVAGQLIKAYHSKPASVPQLPPSPIRIGKLDWEGGLE